MQSRSAPPGEEGQKLAGELGLHEVGAERPDALWEDYLAVPSPSRIGIAASGGGIRSAAYCLGALQVLRREGILGIADHLACVSGGGYIAIAHTLLSSESLRHHVPGEGATDEDLKDAEESLFGELPPWAPDSPEERNLRDHLSYLAPGVTGKAWLWLNLAYGIVRHLLPFLAAICVAAFVTGVAFSDWIGPSLSGACRPNCPTPNLTPMFWIGMAGLLIAAVIVTVRISTQKRAPRGTYDNLMPRLQRSALVVLAVSAAELLLLWLLPHVLLWLPTGFDQIGSSLAKLTALSGVVGAVAAFIVRRWGNRLVRIGIAVAIAISGPLFLLTPFVGFTYWNTRAWHEGGRARIGPVIVAIASAVVLALLFLWFDEVTSTAHLFYRERLATAFGGFRASAVSDGDARVRYTQPNWMSPIWLSREVSPFVGRQPTMAKLPNLVICAAVNVAEAPVGRLGASFTFETDKSGGPLTGYVPTKWIESMASGGAGTLPGLMAISGAAVAPTMGKMTLPGLRFLMAVFNLRLGVWLPNPARAPWKLTASELRRGVYPIDLDAEDVTLTRKDNPGGLYVFREAFGMNSVRRPFVYVTDGGHWENLGLVELLRRGCGRVIVLDGSGGTNVWFDTLSEAISLARSDLGVEIDINLDALRADNETGWSHAAFAVGRITFPDGHVGSLVYVRAVIPDDAPAEIKSYAARDRKFPNHPTSDQFFADDTFEAYRSLGKHLMQRAVTDGMSQMSDWVGTAPFGRDGYIELPDAPPERISRTGA